MRFVATKPCTSKQHATYGIWAPVAPNDLNKLAAYYLGHSRRYAGVRQPITSFPFFDASPSIRLPTMRATAKSLVESLDVICSVPCLIGFFYL